MSPVEYAVGKRSVRAYVAVCLQISYNPSSFVYVYSLWVVNTKKLSRDVC